MSNPKVNVFCHAGTWFVKVEAVYFLKVYHLLFRYKFRYTHRNFSKLWVHILIAGFILNCTQNVNTTQ